MDRNQIIGLILMLVFITVYFQFFAPEPTYDDFSTGKSDTTAVVSQIAGGEMQAIPTLTDSLKNKINEQKFGMFSVAADGQEKLTQIENEQMIITFSSRGGSIRKVTLKEYKDFRGNPLELINSNNAVQHFYVDHLSRKVDLSDMFFLTNTENKVVKSGDSTVLEYNMLLGEGQSVTYRYAIPGDGYTFGFSMQQSGLSGLIGNDIQYVWNQNMNRLEQDFKDARSRTTVKYRYTDGDVDELKGASEEKQEEPLELPATWVSFRQKFFTSAIIAEKPFQSGTMSSFIDFTDTTSIKNMNMSLALSGSDFMAGGLNFKYYFGPNNYYVLKEVAPDFSENVELGWSVLGWINKYAVIPIFHLLEKFIPSYGLIIIIMVIIIRIVLSPLTYKSHLGMAKMRVMKPELDEIKEKYPDDMQKAQQEQMALYQKVGINPLSGCIPMLLQMPILFAMFYFFPNSIELRQQSFLWAHDLSTYDSIINLPFNIPFYGDHVSMFTLLMTASTILYTWSNSQITTVQGPMKSLQYIMPIMFLFFLNNYAAGLTFYYFVSNIASFGQIALFRKFIDEDKIKQILDENRKKNATKKKSSFQQRLEDAMKAQNNKGKESKNKN